jgi:hypothetical protein
LRHTLLRSAMSGSSPGSGPTFGVQLCLRPGRRKVTVLQRYHSKPYRTAREKLHPRWPSETPSKGGARVPISRSTGMCTSRVPQGLKRLRKNSLGPRLWPS